MPETHIETFYQFAELPEYRQWQAPLRALCDDWGLKGTILLAAEGINATLAGSRQGTRAVLKYLRADPRFAHMPSKHSTAEQPPFLRMKVRLKREIVTLGREEANPARAVGRYVKPRAWNALLQDPDVLVLDTRNDYEVRIGSFHRAQDPKLDHFRQFPDYVAEQLDPGRHRKVAMFCTGGIRCEKASSYMLAQGFEEVYQLEGGILKYLEEVPEGESLWQGECFVFDDRVSVGQGLSPGEHRLCRGCRAPLCAADRTHPHYREGVQCPHCAGRYPPEHYRRAEERWKQVQLAERGRRAHLGGEASLPEAEAE
ncbi:rhodanese-related sulfurtransferase [Alkalilimnicola sp. S0819]|uniref:oxygen-dependent tRNA uridine(34) hydroxylase TrhO n=1 Tax=Alkalilimnicola sp. S0819 TaxID=2613922 RepID=UPI001261D91E|nr:rhodanese-related sulfurtransferase [Alkalilimnicola sp. S0819]KAB7619650.1 rhodanese-related sulfurtransferase [Alkalilimnicola sp. S0819]MPQ17588.1 rhodanese-related sulfurtransferase [Alkalilimnicola sp. S0819]